MLALNQMFLGGLKDVNKLDPHFHRKYMLIIFRKGKWRVSPNKTGIDIRGQGIKKLLIF